MKGFLFKVKASSALVWVQRLESDEYFPFVTSEATFDHKMHPNSIDDLIGLKRKILNPISFLLVDVFSEKI